MKHMALSTFHVESKLLIPKFLEANFWKEKNSA